MNGIIVTQVTTSFSDIRRDPDVCFFIVVIHINVDKNVEKYVNKQLYDVLKMWKTFEGKTQYIEISIKNEFVKNVENMWKTFSDFIRMNNLLRFQYFKSRY